MCPICATTAVLTAATATTTLTALATGGVELTGRIGASWQAFKNSISKWWRAK